MEKLADNKPKVDNDLDEGSEEQAIDNATTTDAKKKKKKNKKNKTKQPTDSTPTDAGLPGTQVMALETPKTQPLAGETADRQTVKITEATGGSGVDGQADAEKKKKKKKSRLLCDPREEENCRRRCRKRQ